MGVFYIVMKCNMVVYSCCCALFCLCIDLFFSRRYGVRKMGVGWLYLLDSAMLVQVRCPRGALRCIHRNVSGVLLSNVFCLDQLAGERALAVDQHAVVLHKEKADTSHSQSI